MNISCSLIHMGFSNISGVPFVKMHGTGNDFVIFGFDEDYRDCDPEFMHVTHIASRRFGVGCDQVIFVTRSEFCSCKMIIYNAGGTEAEMCGNAARCVAKLLIDSLKVNEVTIEMSSGRVLFCGKSREYFFVNMGPADFDAKKIFAVQGIDYCNVDIPFLDCIRVVAVDMGNPHLVCFFKSLSDIDVNDLGPKLEHIDFFPSGINVEFVEILSDQEFLVRVWERNVGETMSCGSGACAVFAAANKVGLTTSQEVSLLFKGGKLDISFSGKSLILAGPVSTVFTGEYFIGNN